EAEGWVARDRPTAEEARRGARTRYRLMIPADAADAEDAEPVEPVEEVEEVEEVEPEPVDQAEPVEEGRGATPPPGEEVGAPRPHGRGATPPDKRRHAPTGMGATPPKSSMSSMSDVQSSPAPARGTTGTALADRTPTIETELADEPAAYAARLALAEHTSRPISPAHARAVAAAILARARGQVGDPVAYVTAAVHRDPTPHIPAPMPPTVAEATRRPDGATGHPTRPPLPRHRGRARPGARHARRARRAAASRARRPTNRARRLPLCTRRTTQQRARAPPSASPLLPP